MTNKETVDLPLMRAAFRATMSGPSGCEMTFRFRSLEDLHKADDEWREFRSGSTPTLSAKSLDPRAVNPRELIEGATEGPWTVYPYVQYKGQFAIEAKNRLGFRVEVGQTFMVADGDGNPNANARLIAAAPQLALTCISQEERIAELRLEVRRIAEHLSLQGNAKRGPHAIEDRLRAKMSDCAASLFLALTNTGEVR